MPSEKSLQEKLEKQQVWKLEEQLDDEQYAHRKTKFALRDVQEKLEEMSLAMENQEKERLVELDLKETIEDLRRENSRLVASKNENEKSIENLKQEKEDLKNTIKEQSEEIRHLNNNVADLEKKNREHLQPNIDLIKKSRDFLEIGKKELEEKLKNNTKAMEKLDAALKQPESCDLGKLLRI